jgi:hypothetical protein
VAEEVTLSGGHERRPDVVLYLNGLAVAVLELKNSRVSVGHGIRQNLSNQLAAFNAWFFSTVQLVLAGNDSEGLRYGAVGTPEKLFLTWKEDEADNAGLQTRQVPGQAVQQGPAAGAGARLRAVRRRHEEAAAGAPALRDQGRAGACAAAARRHHLAHPGRGQEHPDGAAGGSQAVRVRGRVPPHPGRQAIDQQLGNPAHVDQWFEAKTRGLNAWQKDELKKQWGTLQQLLSSKARMGRVVADTVHDFATKPRLSSERGNDILVAGRIYEACKYFVLFSTTVFKGRCAVVTSYNPNAQHVTLEETGANTETYEQDVKERFPRGAVQGRGDAGARPCQPGRQDGRRWPHAGRGGADQDGRAAGAVWSRVSRSSSRPCSACWAT